MQFLTPLSAAFSLFFAAALQGPRPPCWIQTVNPTKGEAPIEGRIPLVTKRGTFASVLYLGGAKGIGKFMK